MSTLAAGVMPGPYKSSPPPRTTAGRAAILVVDDDERSLFALQQVLGELDAEIVTASSGTQALRLVLQRDFAAILLDVNMPDMDGYEVAALIRQRERSRVVPIIFLTGVHKEDMHVFHGYSTGAVDYVMKPAHPVVLMSKVGIFIDLYNQRRAYELQVEARQRVLAENLRIQEELRRNQEREAHVLRVLPLALYSRNMAEPAMPLVFFGANIEEMVGFSRQSFLADERLWEERIHPDDRERVLAALAEAVHSRPDTETFSLEYRWRNADGLYRIIFDQGSLVRGRNGAVVEVVGSWLDVTERRHADEQLAQMRKIDAIGQLTGGIAHDFNNMLTVVIGSLDRLRSLVPDDAKAQKQAEMALQGALRCSDLTKQLLTFARRRPLEPKPVRLGRLLAGLTGLLRRTLQDQVELDITVTSDCRALVDPVQMESAIINLVVNARDAMPEGGKISVEVSGESLAGDCRLADGDYAVLRVRDTGSGMAPEVLERALEPFFTTKEVGRGTGLGLSIVYGMIQQQGGDLRIESQEGHGTTVSLYLPQVAAEEAPCDAEASEEMPRAKDGEVVLAVEDDTGVRTVVALLLRDLGYRVIEAADGAAALAALEQAERVDLLFSDVSMPGWLNGYELGQKARSARPHLRVLLTSAYADLAHAGEPWPTMPLLAKPYRDDELARMIRAALDMEGDGDGPTEHAEGADR